MKKYTVDAVPALACILVFLRVAAAFAAMAFRFQVAAALRPAARRFRVCG